jgi:hypothetical protein
MGIINTIGSLIVLGVIGAVVIFIGGCVVSAIWGIILGLKDRFAAN